VQSAIRMRIHDMPAASIRKLAILQGLWPGRDQRTHVFILCFENGTLMSAGDTQMRYD
jgi:hypothetical protein